MQVSLLSLLSAAALTLGAPAPRAAAEGVVVVPFERHSAPAGGLSRRSTGPVSDKIQNQQRQYVATVQVGTPPQSQEVILDTGSSDLWLYGQNSGISPSYDGSKSSTYQVKSPGRFSIDYLKGAAKGDWVQDTLSVDGLAPVRDAVFGVSQTQSPGIERGVFGVGLTDHETLSSLAVGGNYPNYPALLKNAGYVLRNAYSLYLSDADAKSGTILFGGIDSAKYEGKLNRVKLVSKTEFAVDFEFYGFKGTGILDSGTTAIYTSPDSFQAAVADLQRLIPALQNVKSDWLVENEADIPKDKSIKLTIAGVDYEIGLGNLFAKVGIDPRDQDWYLLLTPYDQGSEYPLGEPLLRSLYVVYDLDGGEVALAPAKYTDESKINAIPASGIPDDL